ncbi:MAG: type I methionyl aminopeptidase [Fibrobacter sp.]|nr:type I methionyl aminopeptidase [Fibrobacter sp.]
MSRIRIKSAKEIALIRDSSRLSAEILQLAGEMVKPGITTDEINTFVHDYTVKHGAVPSPLNYNGFPKSVCTSVNDVVTHGIPDNYVLKKGDIINIDVTSQLKGYHGDCSATFAVGEISEEAKELMQCSLDCLDAGIEVCALPQARISDIGAVIEDIATERDFTVVRDYCGHGIGRQFHEEPLVLHYRQNRPGPVIREGMVFTIEPMINAGDWRVRTLDDGWTVLTVDGSLSAQYEHTIAITKNGPEILTVV